jgi:Flp pilus assembly protein TadG
MVEMALVAPFLLLILMAMIDFGRAAWIYATLSGAARDGARVAILTGPNRSTNANVVGNVQLYAIGMSLSIAPCVNGQTAGNPWMPAPAAGDTGYVYVTGSTQTSTYDAPAGQAPTTGSGNCAGATPAFAQHVPLTVTVEYNFQPLTPLAAQFLPSGIVMSVSSTMTTEY